VRTHDKTSLVTIGAAPRGRGGAGTRRVLRCRFGGRRLVHASSGASATAGTSNTPDNGPGPLSPRPRRTSPAAVPPDRVASPPPGRPPGRPPRCRCRPACRPRSATCAPSPRAEPAGWQAGLALLPRRGHAGSPRPPRTRGRRRRRVLSVPLGRAARRRASGCKPHLVPVTRPFRCGRAPAPRTRR